MIRLRDKWAAMIDVTNRCEHACLYCIKYMRRLRPEHKFIMSSEQVRVALNSLARFPGKVGITGGEPTLVPHFAEICQAVQDIIPKYQAMLFTSSKRGLEKYQSLIDRTFGEVFVNLHTPEQKAICTHQPNLLAVGDVVKDKAVRDVLIAECWCNRMWSPVINPYGAFFCDCAAGLESIFHLGAGWAVTDDWWRRGDYQDQMNTYCSWCGMCVPVDMPTQDSPVEMISLGLMSRFESLGLARLDELTLYDKTLDLSQIMKNTETWRPWHNRQDRSTGEGPEYVNG